MKRPRSKLHTALLVEALAVALGALGCSAPEVGATVLETCPDRAGFTAVSPFLEAGCGTIDCHGASGRPLRIHGHLGLRLDPSAAPGDTPTTPEEVSANWRAVCGLQPELTALVVSGDQPPTSLLLVTKPRAEERHEGNAVVKQGDDGDRCVTTWLAGAVDAAACSRAAAREVY